MSKVSMFIAVVLTLGNILGNPAIGTPPHSFSWAFPLIAWFWAIILAVLSDLSPIKSLK